MKKPFRPNADVTQSFSDGMVTVYSVADKAKAGYKPVEKLTFKVKLPYEEQRLGVQRYYSAKQNQIEIERVIRVPISNVKISNQDVAETEDGVKYRIDLVQAVKGVFPPSADLTLKLLTQKGMPGAGSEGSS